MKGLLIFFILQRSNPFVNTILGADNIFEFCEKIKNEASHMQNLYQSLVSKVKQIFFSCLIQKLKSNFTYVSLTIN